MILACFKKQELQNTKTNFLRYEVFCFSGCNSFDDNGLQDNEEGCYCDPDGFSVRGENKFCSCYCE